SGGEATSGSGEAGSSRPRGIRLLDSGPKQQQSKPAKPSKPEIKVVSEIKASVFKRIMEAPLLKASEIADSEDKLAAALETYLEYIDKGIWWLAKDKSEQPIWSDMDDEERHVIARVLLRASKTSHIAAYIVHGALNFEDDGKFLVIVAPRLWETGKAVIPVVVPMVSRKRARAHATLP
ncbi:MAG: hypothetical protein ACRD72_20115, partial [Candidatus Angelobacter sp.]